MPVYIRNRYPDVFLWDITGWINIEDKQGEVLNWTDPEFRNGAGKPQQTTGV